MGHPTLCLMIRAPSQGPVCIIASSVGSVLSFVIY